MFCFSVDHWVQSKKTSVWLRYNWWKQRNPQLRTERLGQDQEVNTCVRFALENNNQRVLHLNRFIKQLLPCWYWLTLEITGIVKGIVPLIRNRSLHRLTVNPQQLIYSTNNDDQRHLRDTWKWLGFIRRGSSGLWGVCLWCFLFPDLRSSTIFFFFISLMRLSVSVRSASANTKT